MKGNLLFEIVGQGGYDGGYCLLGHDALKSGRWYSSLKMELVCSSKLLLPVGQTR
jgi:hypothetical protein